MQPHIHRQDLDGRLRGFSVDECSFVAGTCHRLLRLAGWAIGEQQRATAVECRSNGAIVARFSLNKPRPDVQSAHPSIPAASACGFAGTLSFTTSPASGIEVNVVLASQERVPIATVASETPRATATGPRVSIVIPCYRQAHFLGDSIGSVLGQTYEALEIVVVDDGSPDNTEEIVRRHPGVQYVRQENSGLAAARNAGARVADGEYIVFLDADDRLLPDALETSVSIFREHPEYGLVAGQFRFVGLNGVVLATPQPRVARDQQYPALVADYFVGPPGTMMFRRNLLAELGGFDTAISPAADYDMALRVARRFPICVHASTVLDYRRHGASMSSNPAAMLTTTMTVLRRQRRFVNGTMEGREAYRAGRRHWQRAWGRPLVHKVVADFQAGINNAASRGLFTLLQHYPRGALEVAAMLASGRQSVAICS